MTTRRVALLRGINVGKAKRVRMADLRALAEGLGYRHVETLLNSGNVVLTAPGRSERIASDLERGIERELGVESRVTVLSAPQFREAVAENPLPDAIPESRDEPSKVLVAFPSTTRALRRLEPLAGHDWAPEGFSLGSRAAYLWCPHGTIRSAPAKEMNRLLGDQVTTRNWSTVQKLHDML